MQIESWQLEKLIPYEKNPRKNDHAVEAVAKAIKEYGFRVPILVRSSGQIIDGHLRYKAAIHLGLEKVLVMIADDLTDEQVRQFRISVNKVSELAKWDISLLQQEMQELSLICEDLSAIGFTEVELEALINPAPTAKDIDEVPEHVDPVVQMGDVWHLGDHKLCIGDSTKPSTYTLLLEGDAGVDMVWTDPPYNVDYSSKAGKIKNDKMSPAAFETFLSSFSQSVSAVMKPGAPIYVAHADGVPGLAFRKAFLHATFHLSACLIWRKSVAVMGRSDYHFQHEPILYGWKEGGPHKWYGGRKRKTIIDFSDGAPFTKVGENTYHLPVGNDTFVITGKDIEVRSLQPTVISIDKPLASKLHPTMKPVALVEHCIINSSAPGDIVADCFGGSGTTLMACESKGRRARLIEFDEKFGDVIICRWQEYTGKQATLSGGGSYSDVRKQREECKPE